MTHFLSITSWRLSRSTHSPIKTPFSLGVLLNKNYNTLKLDTKWGNNSPASYPFPSARIDVASEAACWEFHLSWSGFSSRPGSDVQPWSSSRIPTWRKKKARKKPPVRCIHLSKLDRTRNEWHSCPTSLLSPPLAQCPLSGAAQDPPRTSLWLHTAAGKTRRDWLEGGGRQFGRKVRSETRWSCCVFFFFFLCQRGNHGAGGIK